MEKLVRAKSVVCSILGAAGALFMQLFGGWSEDMATLVILMIVDYISGIIVAAAFKKSLKSENGALSSAAGLKGLCKKGVMIAVVLVAHRMDVSLGVDYIKSAAVMGFIVNELISITENAGLMGVPLPSVVKKAISVLKSKADEEDEK